jgi:hypothetical protein
MVAGAEVHTMKTKEKDMVMDIGEVGQKTKESEENENMDYMEQKTEDLEDREMKESEELREEVGRWVDRMRKQRSWKNGGFG